MFLSTMLMYLLSFAGPSLLLWPSVCVVLVLFVHLANNGESHALTYELSMASLMFCVNPYNREKRDRHAPSTTPYVKKKCRKH